MSDEKSKAGKINEQVRTWCNRGKGERNEGIGRCVKKDEVVCEDGRHDRLSKRGVGGAPAKRGGVDRTCTTVCSLAANVGW